QQGVDPLGDGAGAVGNRDPVLEQLGPGERATHPVGMGAERKLQFHLEARARWRPRRRSVSRVPRAAGTPYNAYAIASSSVVLPEPFGPTIASSPGPNARSVRSCWRKLTSFRRRSCMSSPPLNGVALHLGEHRHALGHELLP